MSSPSDVGYERARAERVAQRLSGLFDGLSIETYRWEDGHYFSAHQTFQTQIPETESFDLVVGILWSTLGSPLPSDWPVMLDGRQYPSGTAFEILRAIEHRRRTDAALPDILVYKKSAGLTVSPDSDEEWDRIQAARKQLRAFFDEWFVSEQDGFKAAFTPFSTADEFERVFEANLRDWIERNRKVGRERRWRVELAEMGSPFRGLEPFGARHSQVFFGRGPDVERARERLEDAVGRGSGFLLIEGASGSGKSSLARAGLLPRLALIDPTQRQAVLEPLSDAKVSPLSQIARALFAPGALPELSQGDFPTPTLLSGCLATGAAAAPIQSALDRAARALAEAEAHDSVPKLNLVLLVDQLEQIFSEAVSKNTREGFCTVLAALVATGRVMVIATLRADTVGDALSIPALAELIDNGARLSLTAPARDALAEIIRAPAAAAGLSFETRHGGTSLDEVLLDTASGADALPLLQFTLEHTYPSSSSKVWKFVLGPGGGSKIEARFTGPDAIVLRRLAEDTKRIFSQNGAIAIKDDWREQVQVIRPVVNTENARRLGLTQGDISNAIYAHLNGTNIGIYREGDELLDVVMRPFEAERDDIDALNSIRVFSQIANTYVPISQVVDRFELVFEAGNLERLNRKLAIMAQADNPPGVLSGDLFDQVRPLVEALDLPPGYALEWRGEYGDHRMQMTGLRPPCRWASAP